MRGHSLLLEHIRSNSRTPEKPAFSEEDIRDMLNPAEGEIFNRGEFEEALLEIEGAYQNKGYLLSEVDASPHFDEINGIVDLTLNITEGDVIIIEAMCISTD